MAEHCMAVLRMLSLYVLTATIPAKKRNGSGADRDEQTDA